MTIHLSTKGIVLVAAVIAVLLVSSSIGILSLYGTHANASTSLSSVSSSSGQSLTANDPSSPRSLTGTTLVSAPPSGLSGPDDLTWLSVPGIEGGQPLLWTEYQNGIQPNGEPSSKGATTSNLVAYDPYTGTVIRNIAVKGHVDGLSADPALGKLLVTSNEDANSTFNVVDPLTSTVTTFQYSPDPIKSGNGGTDSVAVLNGHIYVAHSNPNDVTVPAMYEVNLDYTSLTAYILPVFYCNSTATNSFTGALTHLGLTDPDTNLVLPNATPRFGGQIAQVSQGDGQIIFVSISAPYAPYLTVMNVTDNKHGIVPPIDGMAVATSNSGTLFVVDSKAGTIQALNTTGFAAGTMFIDEPSDNGNPLVGTLNLTTGVITPFNNQFQSPKGMLFVPNN